MEQSGVITFYKRFEALYLSRNRSNMSSYFKYSSVLSERHNERKQKWSIDKKKNITIKIIFKHKKSK